MAFATASLLMVWLASSAHYERWENTIATQAPEQRGEGLVIHGNGLGYYAWLRSLVIDHNWDFANEFDDHQVAGDWVPPATYLTPIGRRANQWSIGPACVWAVTVVPVHLLLVTLGESSPWPANGYSLPYQIAVGVAGLASALLCLFFLYGICCHWAETHLAALAAVLLTLASTVGYFGTIELSMAHGPGALAVAALVWYWLKTYGSVRAGRWFVLGMLLGIAMLMRWQLVTFGVLFIGEILLTAHRRLHLPRGRQFMLRASLLLACAAGTILAFLPQMIAWRCVYGSWLVNPIQGINYHWSEPSLWAILCSQDRSLFYWTPLTALAFLGILFGCLYHWAGFGSTQARRASEGARRPLACASGLCGNVAHSDLGVGSQSPAGDAAYPPLDRISAPGEALSLLLVAFAVQVYALGSVWGQGTLLEETGNFGGAFLSRAYGMRHLTEAVVVLAPGLALLFQWAVGKQLIRVRFLKPFPLLVALAFFLTIWNLLLILQYVEGSLPADSGLSPRELLVSARDFLQRDFSILLPLEALVLIGYALLWVKPTSDAFSRGEAAL